MKKLLTVFLCASLTASLCACGGAPASQGQAPAPQAPSASAVAPAPENAVSQGDIDEKAKAAADEQIELASTYATLIENIPEITPDEEEAWKSEPAYGQTIRIGYNGGLCLGGFGIAQMKGFYEAEGLKTEVTKMSTQIDALGTGKVDVAGDHIATLLVPTVNGVNMTFTTGIHTGCKTLYALTDGDINSTADLVGKTVGLPDGIGASDQNITYRFLNHDGVDPTSVKYKVVESSACILAMQNGEIQAATLDIIERLSQAQLYPLLKIIRKPAVYIRYFEKYENKFITKKFYVEKVNPPYYKIPEDNNTDNIIYDKFTINFSGYEDVKVQV